jgi:hypothetical protein
MKKIELIKMEMEENLRILNQYQETQLAKYEYIMSLSDIDDIDLEIQKIEEEFKFTTLFNEIKTREKNNLNKLINLAWENKAKEWATNE